MHPSKIQINGLIWVVSAGLFDNRLRKFVSPRGLEGVWMLYVKQSKASEVIIKSVLMNFQTYLDFKIY